MQPFNERLGCSTVSARVILLPADLFCTGGTQLPKRPLTRGQSDSAGASTKTV